MIIFVMRFKLTYESKLDFPMLLPYLNQDMQTQTMKWKKQYHSPIQQTVI